MNFLNLLRKIKNRLVGKALKKSNLLVQLSQNKHLINPQNIIAQIQENKKVIEYQYKNHTLYTNNESATIYHLVHSIEKIEKLVEAIDLDRCETILDVGANTGLFAYFVKNKYPESFIYIFEPDEKLWPIIHANLSKDNKYEVVKYAVTDTDNDNITFYINTQSAQTNSTIKEAVSIVVEENSIIEKQVETITLDTFCKLRNIKNVDVLKIDIQGNELQAFSKSHEVLKMTTIVLAEVTFMVDDTFEFIDLIKKYYNSYTPINGVLMGADLKFYNRN